MARTAGIWLRKDNGYFYTTLRGEKIKLSQDRKESQKLFHGLMAKDEEPDNRPPVWSPTRADGSGVAAFANNSAVPPLDGHTLTQRLSPGSGVSSTTVNRKAWVKKWIASS